MPSFYIVTAKSMVAEKVINASISLILIMPEC